MPNQQGRNQDDTSSIRSSVSSIFPSFSSNRKGRRRPLSNLWVFTNNSRAQPAEHSATPGRPQSSAAFYGSDTLDIPDGRKTPTTRAGTPWLSHNATPSISPLPPFSDGDTTPTSAQTSIPSTPHGLLGVSSLRRNGKLLRAGSSALNSPISSVSPSAATTPKIGLFEIDSQGSTAPDFAAKELAVATNVDQQLGVPSKDASITTRKDAIRLRPNRPVIARVKQKELKTESGNFLRKSGSREGPLDIAQEIRDEEQESAVETEKDMPGELEGSDAPSYVRLADGLCGLFRPFDHGDG
jgi:hypothetical protein